MSTPLIKTNRWEYKINGHFYGLTVNPHGSISSSDGKNFKAVVAAKELNTCVFRDAFDFLIKHSVKPYFTTK